MMQRHACDAFALHPLVLAILSALPLLAQGQAGVRLPLVPANALPVPAAPGWRVNGSGGAWAPVTSAQKSDAVITQSSPRAIYHWQSFDIGASSSLRYQFGKADGSALNRVTGSVAPSQILGRLSSTVPGANGTPVSGGTVLLINQNGILFGPKSQVDTGALIASTLNVADADYLSGFDSTLRSTAPTFVYEGGPELFADSRSLNFVRVDSGAVIQTPSGGRVFLFAKNVDNAGTLRTPGGQTVLAAGDQVFLNDPLNERLFASEANAAIPALRGLLVEVGGAPGRVGHSGVIEVPRGNATLVGMAVNQSGRISATTSVSENGSVFLLARGATVATDQGTVVKRATQGGELTLVAGSRVAITPDDSRDAQGALLTADSGTTFTTSRAELSGRSITFQNDASIVAPGGIVNARAEAVPTYSTADIARGNFGSVDDAARLVLGAGATIDVAGTTSTEVSAARNFVTTELLGANDLKDAPLQRDGPLYRSRINFDLRKSVPILGDTSSYASAVQRTAAEKMAGGGSVSLAAAGAVITAAASQVDVAGGRVTFTDAMVRPSTLIAADGSRYSPNDAPADIRYRAIEGGQASQFDRWGRVTPFGPERSRLEPGYVEGRDAGTLKISAPTALIGGEIAAGATQGVRQLAGVDALAKDGGVELGTRISAGGPFGSDSGAAGVLRDFTISAAPRVLPPALFNPAAPGGLPSGGWVAAETLNQSGAGTLRVTSYGNLQVEPGAALEMPNRGSVELNAAGAQGVTLGGDITARGGSVLVQTVDATFSAEGLQQAAGGVTLQAGRRIDVSGDWVNQSLSGARAGSAVAGGSVQLLSAHGLDLQNTSAIDVSGGATVGTGGAISGSNAGSIRLDSQLGALIQASSAPVAPVHIGADLRGASLAGGGSLRLRAAEVDIRDTQRLGPRPPIRDGDTVGSLIIDDDFFSLGGFTSFGIEGAQRLGVNANTALAPQATRWVVAPDSRFVPTGTRPADALAEVRLPEGQRNAASIRLASSGLVSGRASGDLSLGRGASIRTDAGGNVTLSALRSLVVDEGAHITAPGGKATLELSRAAVRDGIVLNPVFQLRAGASVDVSGKTVLQLSANGLRQGRVFDAGSISMAVLGEGSAAPRDAMIDLAAGAALRADGARDTLDLSTRSNAGTQIARAEVHSAGGSIAIDANDGGARIAGQLSARSGGGTASDGSLAVRFAETRPSTDVNPLLGEYRIEIGNAPLTAAAPGLGVAAISARTIRDGRFADVTLRTPDRIAFSDSTTLEAGRSIRLQAPVVSAAARADVRVSAPGSVTLGAIAASSVAAEPPLVPNSATLHVAGGRVSWTGTQELRQFESVAVDATSRLQFDAAPTGSVARASGSLHSPADLRLNAPQTVVTTATDFVIDAPGRRISFGGGDASAAPVLSAGGSLRVNAAQIEQGGVVLAPFGRIAFNASESVSLRPGSVTSVSGTGLTVPFGSLQGGTDWSYRGAPVAAPPEKAISLSAPGQSVNVEAGARLGLAGGGALFAQEFVPGPGGSRDVFTGALDGSFAIIPGIDGYAPVDAEIARLASAAGAVAPIVGQQITIGAGSTLPAGTYAVLPARYALLPGAFLLTPSASTTALAPGFTLTRPDGAQLVTGRRGSTGTAFLDAQASGYVVRSSAQAQQLSEVRTASADAYFYQQASFNASAVPRLAQDAGSLQIEASRIGLAGTLDFARSATPLAEREARGGEIDIAAERIVVTDSGAAAAAAAAAAEPGTLVLGAAQINDTGAASVLLGGSRSASAGGPRQLNVSAREVVIANAAEVIAVDDLIVAATAQLQLDPYAGVVARASAAPSDALATVGDGALLRASADADASVTRTAAQRLAGTIDIGAGANLDAAGLIVESTAGTQIAADAQLLANTLTISAPRVALGNTTSTPGVEAPGSDSLVVGPALAGTLAAAERLTLRSFSSIDIYGSTALGSASQRELTLDSAALALLGEAAEVGATAGGLRLTNSSGSVGAASDGTGRLSLQASGANGGSGDVVLGAGSVALQGVGDARFTAVRSTRFEDGAALQAGGRLLMAAPTLLAAQSATASVSAGGLLRIEPGPAPAAGATLPAGGAGAALTLSGARVEQAGTIDLPSGRLDLIATGPTGLGVIAFEAGSSTLLAGRSTLFDSVAVTTSGGDLRANAQSGDVIIHAAAGPREAARIDVSAGGAAAHAGSLRLSASSGAVEIGGSLHGAAGAARGGMLAIDSGVALDLGALAATLAQGATQSNFGAGISVRNRIGDQLLAAGSTLKAQAIELSADAGGLTIAGTLDASGADGGSVALAARDNLALVSGGRVLVNASAPGADGGQMSAASRSGRITLGAGAAIDASGAGGGHDGRVALRAARVGAAEAAASGSEVQVDAIGTAFTGVQRIDVEALKVYDYASSVTVNSALASTIAAHNSAFAGSNGEQANTILARLVDGDAALRGQLHLRAGVELRSRADITVASNWNLTPFAANGSVSRPGDEPMNLTLRAAGNLNIAASISDGFRAGGPSAPTTGAAAARIIPEATIVAGGGAAMRLVGGADLDAASTLATLDSGGIGDVIIGRANADVLLRTSSGDIDIAAGRDVRLLNRQAVVYSAGTPVPVADLAGWVRPLSPGSAYAVVSGSTVQSPMLNGGGSVTVQAGRDVLGATNGRTQYGSNWWWRGDSASDTDVVSWWSRYDKFRQGFGSLGGGDVSVSAGRDARDVQLAAGSSGYIVPGQDGAAPTVVAFGAGSATLRAGRDVAGGLVFATGPRIEVHAGNDLSAGTPGSVTRSDTYLQVLHGNSAVDLEARRNAAVGRVSSPGFVPAASQFVGTQATVAFAIGGLSADASLRAVASSGAMDYRAEPPQTNDVDGVNPGGSPLRVIPAQALIAAPAGSASVGATPTSAGISQLPSRRAGLVIASRDDLQLGSILVNGVTAAATTPGRYAFADIANDAGLLFGIGRTPLQADGADAVRLVSAQGDLRLTGAIEVAAPLRIRAARDVAAGLLPIQMQHQSDAAVSLIEAGRDINLGDSTSAGVRVHGPGDLVVLAGRNVDFSSSQGFAALGNRENSALPAQSAALTVVGGVADGDWHEAQARYFHLLGATGVDAHPGELVAQLDAAAAGLPLPSLGSAVATAFDALPAAQQVEAARLRVGDAAFDATLLTLMRRQPGGAALTQAEARTKFDAQTDSFKKVLVGSVLAAQWSGDVPADGQRELAVALAQRPASAGGERHGAALSAFIARRTGSTPANLDEALLAFDTLPPEQQLIFSNQVLVSEVRSAGRAAAVLSGEAREQAYAKAYAAIDTVFPSIGTEGDLLMGVSQVKTLQGSGIVMLTPRGGINVGELASGGVTKPASDLGIVTTAGGDISLLVRDDVDVNQSRVFTVDRGDLLIWAGQGNIDAGRGAKTVTGAPPPVYRIVDGRVEVDTSGSFSGSGIAVLDADSTLDLYAPRGEINAGDAGIKSLGSAFLGALSFVGADNLAISGAAVGAPPPASTGGTTAALAATSQSPAVAATQVNPEDSEEERQRKRRNRLALILDFLGYGEAATKP